MTADDALKFIDCLLEKEKLNNLQEIIFRQSWEQKTYTQIAASCGYSNEYIRDQGAKLWYMLSQLLGETINKQNFKAVLERHLRSQKQLLQVQTRLTKCNLGWKQVMDVSSFYGRSQELTTLTQWIVDDHCRLVGILGIGGIGKTALAIKLAQNIKSEFDYLIWLSLEHKPTIEQLLTDILQVFSQHQQAEDNLLQDNIDQISQLTEYFYRHRCLLILDKVENILQPGVICGHYAAEFKQYSELFQRLGETSHQSCLVLISREKPREFIFLEGENLPVRSLQIKEIQSPEVQKITRLKSNFMGSDQDWQVLIDNYGGNPLILKFIASTIQDLFAGEINQFLNQKTLLFNDIDDLLREHFCRLSQLEKQIIYTIATENKPITLSKLSQDLLNDISPRESIEGIESLQRRSLIQRNKTSFSLQPFIQAYVVNQLAENKTNDKSSGKSTATAPSQRAASK